jgi:hypothetical protein
MNTLRVFSATLAALILLASPALAEEVLLYDGHSMHGKVHDENAKGFKLTMHTKGGGSITMGMAANQVDPHWWYARRDAALGDDAKQRLELATWAVEHGLFRRAKAQFEKARKLDPKAARDFHDRLIPQLREGVAHELVHSAKHAMNSGELKTAHRMLQAVLTRFGDTHAAGEARALQPTLQHRTDVKLRKLAYWKKFGDDERAREQADQRRKITGPIVALIRQGHNIMGHMPPMAAQADAATHTRQAGLEFTKATQKIDEALKAHGDDKELVARLKALRSEAHGGLIQSHVTAGDVYASTGNYTHALREADTLKAIDAGSAHALRERVRQSQSWDDGGITAIHRGAGRRGGGGRRR